MKDASCRSTVVMVVGCALAAALFSGPVQARDNDRDRDDTGRAVRRDRNHDRDNTGRYRLRNRASDRGRHNGYAYGQYRSRYRGNGYYSRRNASAPFAYIGAADQRRYGYSRRLSRHRHHHRH